MESSFFTVIIIIFVRSSNRSIKFRFPNKLKIKSFPPHLPLAPSFTVPGSRSFNRFSTTITVKHPLHQVVIPPHIHDSPHSATTTILSSNNHITGISRRVGEGAAAVLAVAIHLVSMWTAVVVRNMPSPRPQLTSLRQGTNSSITGTVSIIREVQPQQGQDQDPVTGTGERVFPGGTTTIITIIVIVIIRLRICPTGLMTQEVELG